MLITRKDILILGKVPTNGLDGTILNEEKSVKLNLLKIIRFV